MGNTRNACQHRENRQVADQRAGRRHDSARPGGQHPPEQFSERFPARGGIALFDHNRQVSEGSIATIRGEVAKRLAEFQFPAGFHAKLLTPGVALAMDNPGILAGMAAVVIGLFLAALCIGGWSRTSLLFLLAPAALLGAIAIPLAAGFIGAGHVAGFAVLVTLAFSGLLVGAESDGVFKYLGQDDAASAAESVRAASGNLAALAMILGLAAATVIVGEIEAWSCSIPWPR